MIFYSVDIRLNETGEIRRIDMPKNVGLYAVGWCDGDDGSLYSWRQMYCDCNLGWLAWGERNTRGTCAHSMPTKKYTALKAYLSDGREVELHAD